jgi:hypothetical protein
MWLRIRIICITCERESVNYLYVKDNLFNEVKNGEEWSNQFEKIHKALGVSCYELDGTYKDMDSFIGDITIAYLKFQHDINKQRFSGL